MDLNPFGSTPDDVGFDAALTHFLPGSHQVLILVNLGHHAFCDEFFLSQHEVRGRLRSISGADQGELVVGQRALGLFALYPHKLKLGDELTGLQPQFLGQFVDALSWHRTAFPPVTVSGCSQSGWRSVLGLLAKPLS